MLLNMSSLAPWKSFPLNAECWVIETELWKNNPGRTCLQGSLDVKNLCRPEEKTTSSGDWVGFLFSAGSKRQNFRWRNITAFRPAWSFPSWLVLFRPRSLTLALIPSRYCKASLVWSECSPSVPRHEEKKWGGQEISLSLTFFIDFSDILIKIWR